MRIRAVYRAKGSPLKSPTLFAEDEKGCLMRTERLPGGNLRLRLPGGGFRSIPSERTAEVPEIRCGFDELFLSLLGTREAAELLIRLDAKAGRTTKGKTADRVRSRARFLRAAARRGRIPGAFRVGGRWLFREAGLKWYAAVRRRGRPRRAGR